MRPPVTLRSIAVVPLLALAAGCSLIPGRGAPKTPSPIHLSVSAGARLNPDEQGESLPTAVRLYQLKSAAKAEGAELAALLRDPKAIFGDDLLAMEELFVEPRGSAEKAEGAELAALLRDPKAIFGDDLLAMEELFVEPRGSAEKVIAREQDTRAVVVVAVFRRPAGEAWRDVVELPSPGRKTELAYALDEYRLARR